MDFMRRKAGTTPARHLRVRENDELRQVGAAVGRLSVPPPPPPVSALSPVVDDIYLYRGIRRHAYRAYIYEMICTSLL